MKNGSHKDSSENLNGINRRQALGGLAGIGLGAALSGCAVPRESSAKRDNPIGHENRLPGTREWLLANTRVDPATRYRCPWIEGYCSHTSVRAGGTISIFVSTNPASAFTLDIYRMGYYGGDGGRLMLSYEPLPGRVQPDRKSVV